MKLSGEKVGIAFGFYAPMHQGHLDVIFKAKKECDAGVIIIVCGSDYDRGTTFRRRRCYEDDRRRNKF